MFPKNELLRIIGARLFKDNHSCHPTNSFLFYFAGFCVYWYFFKFRFFYILAYRNLLLKQVIKNY